MDVERHGIGHRVMSLLLVGIEVVVGSVFAVIDDGRPCHLPVLLTSQGRNPIQVFFVLVHLV